MDRMQRMVGQRVGVVEEHHHAVAGEALERPVEAEDERADHGVELAQQRHHGVGIVRFGERREAAQVGEEHRHFLAVALHQRVAAVAEELGGQARREEPLQLGQAGHFRALLGHAALLVLALG